MPQLFTPTACDFGRQVLGQLAIEILHHRSEQANVASLADLLPAILATRNAVQRGKTPS